MSKSKQLAICGIIAAISLTLMFIGGILSFLSYAIPGLCGALLIVVTEDIGRSKSLLIYAAVSILSLSVVADKTSVMAYILLLGYYPTLADSLKIIKNKLLLYIIKLLIFLVSSTLALIIIGLFTGLDAIINLGPFVLSTAAVLLIITFFIYDYCLFLLTKYYKNVLKPKLFKNFFK